MKRVLRPEEKRIWAQVAATVTPRPGRKTPEPKEPETGRTRRTKPPAKPRALAPGLKRFAEAAGSPPPAERSGEKRVRRGQVEIDGRLDLHGMTQVEAHAALGGFVMRLRERGGRCGLVITGKGRPGGAMDGGGGEGVLRRRLPEWLAEPALAPVIAGYAPAHKRHGGAGAWYVFLKRRG
ncbi:MAG: Smr/MutS family protein [Maricaulaceae bacterium]|jgi:DNA-nicking Smr family endonuclease